MGAALPVGWCLYQVLLLYLLLRLWSASLQGRGRRAWLRYWRRALAALLSHQFPCRTIALTSALRSMSKLLQALLLHTALPPLLVTLLPMPMPLLLLLLLMLLLLTM